MQSFRSCETAYTLNKSSKAKFKKWPALKHIYLLQTEQLGNMIWGICRKNRTSKTTNWSHMTPPSRGECNRKCSLYCHTDWHQHLNAGRE